MSASFSRTFAAPLVCLTVWGLSAYSAVAAANVEGFTEPYKTIQVASPETGILSVVSVSEGDTVQEGAPIASLDKQLHQALLSIAQTGADAQGRLNSALAEAAMRETRLEKLRILHARGHARREELDRAEADLAIAEGNVQAVREELHLKKLEYERIQVQIDRRTVRSPLNGVVITVFKDVGEFVAPNDPVVVEIVQLSPLMATFMMTREEAVSLSVGQTTAVKLTEIDQQTAGVIEFISPATDAESGLVRVKVRIENTDSALHSGERCELLLETN